MPALAERPEFLPPPEGGVVRSFGIAVVAHVLLVLALSVGLQWKRNDDTLAVEAELWSPTVQQAAPRAVEVTPPPPPPPVQQQQPVVQPPPAPPQKSDADIVQEREKQRQAEEQARREEEERQRKLAADRKRQEDLKKQEQAKKEADDRKREEQAKARKDAEDKKREDQAKLRKQKQDEERVAKLREENLKRLQGLAGATGGPSSTGTALQSSAPSASYAGRVVARIKPNIVFTDNVAGNPRAEVEVRLAPDGTIVGRRLTKSSGIPGWDEAVLRAFDRTEQFPRDVDGRVPSSMTLGFRPKDL